MRSTTKKSKSRRSSREKTPSQRKRLSPGAQLRSIRELQGLTLRDVEYQSWAVARELRRKEFEIPFSRLHEIESKHLVPNIFRIYTLSRVYGMKHQKILELYGVPTR